MLSRDPSLRGIHVIRGCASEKLPYLARYEDTCSPRWGEPIIRPPTTASPFAISVHPRIYWLLVFHPMVELGKPCNQPSFLLPSDSLMNIIKLRLNNTSFLSQYASLLGELGDYLLVSTEDPCQLSGTRQLSVSPVPWDYLIWSLFLHVRVVGVTPRDWALPPTTTCRKGILGQQ